MLLDCKRQAIDGSDGAALSREYLLEVADLQEGHRRAFSLNPSRRANLPGISAQWNAAEASIGRSFSHDAGCDKSLCPGRSAAPWCVKDARGRAGGGALLIRDRPNNRALGGPGSAAHHSASLVLHCARHTACRTPRTASNDPY